MLIYYLRERNLNSYQSSYQNSYHHGDESGEEDEEESEVGEASTPYETERDVLQSLEGYHKVPLLLGAFEDRHGAVVRRILVMTKLPGVTNIRPYNMNAEDREIRSAQLEEIYQYERSNTSDIFR